MPFMFKDDKQCHCDLQQVEAMEAAGWSRTKPEPVAKAAPKPEPVKSEESEEAPKPRKVGRPKKIVSAED